MKKCRQKNIIFVKKELRGQLVAMHYWFIAVDIDDRVYDRFLDSYEKEYGRKNKDKDFGSYLIENIPSFECVEIPVVLSNFLLLNQLDDFENVFYSSEEKLNNLFFSPVLAQSPTSANKTALYNPEKTPDLCIIDRSLFSIFFTCEEGDA